MSNNNPHGHIGQPTQNPSWNHLQIPSYIPRQPQLAHMSNERPMVRSPSAWHAPAPPPDSLYNFMSANHKNLEHQMNSLLPRSLLPPFDSMDLSLQSSRSSNSPLNKSVGGHGSGILSHEYGGHKLQAPGQPPPHQHQQHPHQHQHQQQQQQQQQSQSQLHGHTSYPIHSLPSTSPSSLAQQQHQQQQQQPQSQHTHHSQLTTLQSSPANSHGVQNATPQSPSSPTASQTTSKYMNTNGNDCEGMLPPVGSGNGGGGTPAGSVSGNNNSSVSSSSSSGGIGGGPVHPYMRETSDAPATNMARNFETDLQSKSAGGAKPVELVSKECNYASLITNKISAHAQHQTQRQHSPKKQSPMRNYHTQQQQQQHQQQHQHLQQQQQQQSFNNPQNTMKHNGPHTPPTPQSPVMHQQSGGSLHGMDYNQIQPPTHGAYTHQQISAQQQHQQQQQHMSQHLPPPPLQHALHYPPHPHAHQHSHSLLPQQSAQQQQQQAPQLSQQNVTTPQQQHMNLPMHQTQPQQHAHQISPRMQQQQQQHQQHTLSSHRQNSSPPMHHSINATSHLQHSQHLHQHHQNPSNPTRLDDRMTASSNNLSNSSGYKLPTVDLKKSSTQNNDNNAAVADLSPTAVDTPSNNPYETSRKSAPSSGCIPDSAESPSPEAISPHSESLDSNSNSNSGGGVGGDASFRPRLHKGGGETKLSGAERRDDVDFGGVLLPTQGRGGEDLQQRQQQEQLSRNSIPKSPKSSPPEQTMRRSPRKPEIKSPLSTFNKSSPTALSNLSSSYTQHEKNTLPSTPTSPPTASQTLENGRLTTTTSDICTNEESEVETIDKISAMIASTANDSLTHVDANSNSSIKSLGERESSLISTCSPKTKKQRQALKLRNATTEYNSNSNGSSKSFAGVAINASNRCMTMSDNAVAVDELHKELMQVDLQRAEANNDNKSETSAAVAAAAAVGPSIGMRIKMGETEVETITNTHIRQPPPLSPQSNSHSSSSSSSTSSCSNTSHSSIGSKRTTAHMPPDNKVSRSQSSSSVIASTVIVMDDNEKDTQQLEQCKNKSLDDLTEIGALNSNAQKNDVVSAKFEEVENKLEEMFAGIEDEPIIQEPEDIVSSAPVNTTEVVSDLSLALELSNTNTSTQQSAPPPSDLTTELNLKSMNACAKDHGLGILHVRTDIGPPPTKAAKKSTLPSPVQKPIIDNVKSTVSPAPVRNTVQKKNDKDKESSKSESNATTVKPAVAIGRRSGPPRRRLSVAMDTSNLRFLLDDDDDDDPDYMETRPQRTKRTSAAKRTSNNTAQSESVAASKDVIICLDDDDDKPSTSAAAAAALAAKAAATINTPKEKASQLTAVGGSDGTNTKAAPKNSKARKKPDTRKRPNRATGDACKNSGKKKAVGKQRRKQQQNSSDDDTPPAQSSSAAANTDQLKIKSPFILVKKDGSISVVNAPLNPEDSNEKHAAGRQIKKPSGAAGYAHDRRNLRGLHSSTLSNKYDADTTDSTWICVFCKRGPHRLGLGDLFGPYLVTVDCEEYKSAVKAPDALDLDAIFENKRRRVDMIQTHPRNLPVIPAKNIATTLATTLNATRTATGGKKKKKSIDTIATPGTVNTSVNDSLDCTVDESLQSNFLGMTKVSESSYEVWLHEDCIVWAPDVFLVGVRVMGLDAAVWNSTNYICTLCSTPGAVVCCLYRECKLAAHVPCARAASWSLNETTMHVHCQQHATVTMKTDTTILGIRPLITTAMTSNQLCGGESKHQEELKKS